MVNIFCLGAKYEIMRLLFSFYTPRKNLKTCFPMFSVGNIAHMIPYSDHNQKYIDYSVMKD